MSKLKMNCGYCGRKCDLDKDFCIPQDSVYVCKSCYEWQNRVADLEAKLAESEEKKESYRLQNDEHHLQLLQFYSRLGVEAFGADIHEKALESLMIMKEEIEEKNGVRRALSACNRQNDEFADMIKKLESEKEELKQQLAEKEKERHEEWKTGKEWKWEWQRANQKLEQANQDKISFAVEQLINTKGRMQHCILFNSSEDYLNVIQQIDNQIKQLKENK